MYFYDNPTSTADLYTLSLHDALPIYEPLFLWYVICPGNKDNHHFVRLFPCTYHNMAEGPPVIFFIICPNPEFIGDFPHDPYRFIPPLLLNHARFHIWNDMVASRLIKSCY